MEWRSDPPKPETKRPTRRDFLIGAALGGGLVIGFELWPRHYLANLSAASGETIFNAFLKIGSDGHIVAIVPQVELGQASTTLLPQIIADELGADWRMVGVEIAPLNPLYANAAFVEASGWTEWFGLSAIAPLQVTDEGLTLAAFAAPMRAAAAAARMLLITTAAQKWGVADESCETVNGFVTHGNHRIAFGSLAAAAAKHTPPATLKFREGDANRLIGISVPRLDTPSKISGTANFAADMRLPDMVFACVRQGPFGETQLISHDAVAARKVQGAVDVVALPNALICVAQTSFVAGKMLNAAAARFSTEGALASDKALAQAYAAAFKTSPHRALVVGDADSALANGHAETATYKIGLLPHAALEPLCATARYDKGLLEIWTAHQLPAVARDAAARAAGLNPANVIIHSVSGGGSFGRRFELEPITQVASLALKFKRPVQLFWSRAEDMAHDRVGGGWLNTLTAQVLPDGRINAWRTALAAPATMAQLQERTLGGRNPAAALSDTRGQIARDIIASAQPPYPMPNFALDLHPLDLPVATGPMRGGAALATCFSTESFMNELSTKTGLDPFSFRMALLGDNARLAQCLAKVAALGGWTGGAQGSNQGIACFMMPNAFIAVLAEASMDDRAQVRVSKLSAVVDIGQTINPDIARQQIEGGLLFGVALACASPLSLANGALAPVRFGELKLTRLADAPEINIDLIPSSAPAADAWDLGVPPTAPAIAGALFAGSGKRFRTLPLSLGAS